MTWNLLVMIPILYFTAMTFRSWKIDYDSFIVPHERADRWVIFCASTLETGVWFLGILFVLLSFTTFPFYKWPSIGRIVAGAIVAILAFDIAQLQFNSGSLVRSAVFLCFLFPVLIFARGWPFSLALCWCVIRNPKQLTTRGD